MMEFIKKLLGKNKKKKTEHELFLEFLKTAKDKMNSEIEKSMFKYLEEIYKFAIASQKKEEKKKNKISTWISQDLQIQQGAERKKAAEENKLPHPTIESTWSGY